MSRSTRATWVKRVEEWRQSGSDIATAAAKFGVAERTLRWWAWRLDRESSSKAKATAKPSADASPSVTFVEVTGVARTEPVEIVLRNELRVRVSAGFDAVTLGRVIDVLERR
jgi:hypothetical protein